MIKSQYDGEMNPYFSTITAKSLKSIFILTIRVNKNGDNDEKVQCCEPTKPHQGKIKCHFYPFYLILCAFAGPNPKELHPQIAFTPFIRQ